MEGTSERKIDLEEVQDQMDDTQLVDTSGQHENVENDQLDDQGIQNVRRSSRISNPPERYGFLVDDCYVVDLDEPTSYKDALSKADKDKWFKAMNVEMQSMYDNQVWDLVLQPPNSRLVDCKWLFKLKTDMHGNLDTYKARLVAKGFTQTQGIDYDETFSPVAMLKSIRILFAIAAHYDYEVWQMDVKTAFLNGYLEEDVYMVQPEGFVDPKHPEKVCKLKKSIYGLKQASRMWNHRFDEEVKKFGFIKNGDEACVYKKASGSTIMFLVLYVDDILLFGNDIPTMQGVKTWLGSCFSIKDLGEAQYILGIRIYRDRSRKLIGLNQSAYIAKILKRFNMENSKKGLVPIQRGTLVVVALSTTESEYIAASLAAQEAAWMKKFIADLGVVPTIQDPLEIFCDNEGAIAQIKEPRAHQKTRHIERRFNYIRDEVEKGKICIRKVHTDLNIADPLTKLLDRPKHEGHTCAMGLRFSSDWI